MRRRFLAVLVVAFLLLTAGCTAGEEVLMKTPIQTDESSALGGSSFEQGTDTSGTPAQITEIPPQADESWTYSTQYSTEPDWDPTRSGMDPSEYEYLPDWAVPWNDELLLAYSLGLDTDHEERSELIYLYTGESNVIDMPELDFTLNLPENWMDRVNVYFLRSGGDGDAAEHLSGVVILNRALYKTLYSYSPVDLSAAIYDQPILQITWEGEDTADMQARQKEIERGACIDGGIKNGKVYTIRTSGMAGLDENMYLAPNSHGALYRTIGKEAYDALIEDLTCEPEQLEDFIQFRN